MKSLITVKFSILFALLLAASISFTACSDVAGPNESTDDLVLSQHEFDHLFDISSHARNRGAGIPAGEGGDYVCGSNSVVLGAGRNASPIGTVQYTLARGGIAVSVDAPGWTITNIRVWVYTDPNFTNNIKGSNLDQDDRYDPALPSGIGSSHRFLVPFSEAGISRGQDFYLIVSVSAENNNNSEDTVTSYGGTDSGRTGGQFWRYSTYIPCDVNGGSIG